MEMTRKLALPARWEKPVAGVLAAVSALILVWGTVEYVVPIEHPRFVVAWDFFQAFKPAALALMHGQSPYAFNVFNPPWAFLPYMPFTLIPPPYDRAAVMAFTLFAFGFAAYRFTGKFTPALVWTLLCPFAIKGWLDGNLDWAVLLGFTLPPQVGLFFVLVKPQIGAGIALFWLVEAWQRGRLREVVRVFAPSSTALLLSFVVFGLYPLNIGGQLYWQASAQPWPLVLVAGVPLLWRALTTGRANLAILASPLLFPYAAFPSYAVTFAGLYSYRVEFYLALLLPWLFYRF